MREREKAQAEPHLEGELAAQVRALDEGRAVVDLTWWRKVLASGSDAPRWLNDLLAADLAGSAVGESRRSLLLSPTGRVRADVTVFLGPEGHLLVQDPDQPEAIDAVLFPYVLSSDVNLEDRTGELALVALPGRGQPPDVALPEGWETFHPSCLGPGLDLVGPEPDHRQVRRLLEGSFPSLVEASDAAVEAWRIARAVPRFPVDLTPESLPHETDLGEAVAYDKGCYLGQEAVARIRNLGRPPFVLVSFRAGGPVSPGDPVLADGDHVGTVTSATPLEGGGTALIARVRWAAQDASLSTLTGESLDPVTPPASSASA